MAVPQSNAVVRYDFELAHDAIQQNLAAEMWPLAFGVWNVCEPAPYISDVVCCSRYHETRTRLQSALKTPTEAIGGPDTTA